MATVHVKITPEVFKWIQNQVEIDKLNQSLKANYVKWINGEKEPTFRQIEDLSRATHIPLGYFFLKIPPIEENELIEFRTVDSLELAKPSRDLIDTINEMERIQDWMKDYLKEQSSENLNFVGAFNDGSDIATVIESIRKTLDISVDWYKTSSDTWNSFKVIREKLESIGIIVMMNGVVGANTHRSLKIEEFRAFTMVDKLAPLIFINAHDSESGRLFSLLHEVAHIWYGVNSLFNDRYCITNKKVIERNCNAIAAEIIVPSEMFVKSWNINKALKTQEVISKLASEFNCGMTVIARKALDNGFITQDKYKELADIAIEKYNEKKQVTSSGGNYYNTTLSRVDKRLLVALNDSAYEGKTAFTDVYRLTNTNRKTFENLIELVRGNAS